MQDKIKIQIVDDHAIFRQGLDFVLSQIDDFDVILEAENGIQMLEQLEKSQPDVTLLDISMPLMDGIKAAAIAKNNYPHLKILTLSSYGDEMYYYKMIKAGASGFVLKKSGKQEIENAIRTVVEGNNFFHEEILKKLAFKTNFETATFETDYSISKRENEVLLLICKGYSNNEIACELSLSPKTVDNHRTKLLNKLGAKNSAHLVMFAMKHKLVSL
jgi:DNA-binding NarL/FixJ family response regulator